MKFIEFYGLPCSGKTYLTRKLKNNKLKFSKNILFIYFRSRSILSIINKTFLIFIALPFLLLSKIFFKLINFFKIFYEPIQNQFISIRTFTLFFNTLYLFSLVIIFKNYKGEIILTDQGFYQILSSIFYDMNISRNDKRNDILIENWSKIISKLEVSHYILKINTPIDLIKKRIKNRRGDSIMENKKNHGRFDSYLEIVQNIFTKLEQKNFDLFSFDKDLVSLDELISKIEE